MARANDNPDLVLKQRLVLPPSPRVGCNIISPFRAIYRPSASSLRRTAITDVILFVPRCRVGELQGIIAIAARDHAIHLHDLCISYGMSGFSFWNESLFDADTSSEANPVYRMVGRAEGRQLPLLHAEKQQMLPCPTLPHCRQKRHFGRLCLTPEQPTLMCSYRSGHRDCCDEC